MPVNTARVVAHREWDCAALEEVLGVGRIETVE